MYEWNVFIGWCGMIGGAVLGMAIGLRAESRDWAGGYGSFRRQAASPPSITYQSV